MKPTTYFKSVLISFILCAVISTCCFAASQQTSSTTGANIITRVRYYVNEPAASIWTDAELLDYMNDGVVDIAARTKCTETRETITLAANVLEYSITVNYIALSAAMYSPAAGFRYGLLRGAPLHVGHPSGYNSSTRIPSHWYDWQGQAAFYPPMTSVSGEAVLLYAVARPDDLTVTTSLVTVPAIYDRALTMYVTAQAFMKTERWARSARFMAEYLAELDRYRQDYVDVPRQPRDLIDKK